MSLKPIECANCGAKYRLPETFKAPKAKCKKCGAMIDVLAQRESPAAPPAAAAAGSTARSSTRRQRADRDDAAAPRRSSGRTSSRRSSRRRGDKGDEQDGDNENRGSREKKGSNTALIAGSAIVVLAVVVVAVIFMMQGDDAAEATNTANNTEQPAVTEQPAATEEPAVTEETAAPAAADSSVATEAADAAATPEAAPKTAKTAELKSRADVFKPSEELDALAWPEFVAEEERTEITDALTAMQDGGIAGKRAKTTLEGLGAKSIVGIVNALREVDYFDSDDTMFAYELNRLLSVMAAGVINAGFRPCLIGDEVPLEDAHWNGKTVKAWQRFAEKYGSDPDSLKRLVKTRKAKHMGR